MSDYTLAVTETGDNASMRALADERLQKAANVSISEAKVTLCEVSMREIEE